METQRLSQNNIKLEPDSEVRPSNNMKLEPVSEVMPSSDIKLEPDSETDCVHSSATEMLTEIPDFDKMDTEIPASVKIEQPEIYVDYPGHELHSSSEGYQSTSIQDHSRLEMHINTEIVKPELSSILYEDICQRSNKMVDVTVCDIIHEITEHSNTESRLTEHGYEASLNHENCCQVSENALQNVDTQVNHAHISVKPLDDSVGYASCSPQRIQAGGAPCISDVCVSVVSVDRHKRTHRILKPFKCDDCGAYFTKVNSLKRHKKTHTGEKCDECGAFFSNIDNLKKHKKKHSGEKPYKCDECGVFFSRADNLKEHKRRHTGEKPYKCDECGVFFSRADNLKEHKRTHTGEKPYLCDECGTSFAAAKGLKDHKRRHTGEKPYKCDECDAFFSRSGNLKDHKRRHTGEKPYKCDECCASFFRAADLKSHKRTHLEEKSCISDA